MGSSWEAVGSVSPEDPLRRQGLGGQGSAPGPAPRGPQHRPPVPGAPGPPLPPGSHAGVGLGVPRARGLDGRIHCLHITWGGLQVRAGALGPQVGALSGLEAPQGS